MVFSKASKKAAKLAAHEEIDDGFEIVQHSPNSPNGQVGVACMHCGASAGLDKVCLECNKPSMCPNFDLGCSEITPSHEINKHVTECPAEPLKAVLQTSYNRFEGLKNAVFVLAAESQGMAERIEALDHSGLADRKTTAELTMDLLAMIQNLEASLDRNLENMSSVSDSLKTDLVDVNHRVAQLAQSTTLTSRAMSKDSETAWGAISDNTERIRSLHSEAQVLAAEIEIERSQRRAEFGSIRKSAEQTSTQTTQDINWLQTRVVRISEELSSSQSRIQVNEDALTNVVRRVLPVMEGLGSNPKSAGTNDVVEFLTQRIKVLEQGQRDEQRDLAKRVVHLEALINSLVKGFEKTVDSIQSISTRVNIANEKANNALIKASIPAPPPVPKRNFDRPLAPRNFKFIPTPPPRPTAMVITFGKSRIPNPPPRPAPMAVSFGKRSITYIPNPPPRPNPMNFGMPSKKQYIPIAPPRPAPTVVAVAQNADPNMLHLREALKSQRKAVLASSSAKFPPVKIFVNKIGAAPEANNFVPKTASQAIPIPPPAPPVHHFTRPACASYFRKQLKQAAEARKAEEAKARRVMVHVSRVALPQTCRMSVKPHTLVPVKAAGSTGFPLVKIYVDRISI